MKAALAVLLIVVASAGVGCATRPESVASRDLLSMQVEEAVSLFRFATRRSRRTSTAPTATRCCPRSRKGRCSSAALRARRGLRRRRARGLLQHVAAAWAFRSAGSTSAVIFFQDKAAFDRFTMEDFTLSAQVTAVALNSGSASRTDYQFGVAIFVVPDQGLMVDASVGGQKFQYEPAFILRDETPPSSPDPLPIADGGFAASGTEPCSSWHCSARALAVSLRIRRKWIA